MSLHRRSFLGGLAGILAYAQAPAVVRDPMRLRPWEWVTGEQGLLVRQPREESRAGVAPRLLMVSAAGLVLADSPLLVHEAHDGRIKMTGGIVRVSGTVASARVVKPGVCDMPVEGLAGVAVGASDVSAVDIFVAVSVVVGALARFPEHDMARVLVEELRA